MTGTIPSTREGSRFAWTLRLVLLGLWLGGGALLIGIAAPAAFRHAPSSTAAADIVGSMLEAWHYIAIGVPLLLLIAELRRHSGSRALATIVLATALLLASAQALLDLRIRSIRLQSDKPISQLQRDDPVRRRFGALHGTSSMLMLLEVLAAVGYAAAIYERRD